MSKYHNRKSTVRGITFDSGRESNHYLWLLDRERRGEVRDIRRQVKYQLLPAVKRPGFPTQRSVNYYADFVYWDEKAGKEVVLDVKGCRTKEYILKKKMMLALLGIDITEA